MLIAVVLAGCGSTGSTSDQAPITLLVAASTRNAIEEIVQAYRQANPSTKFRISSGPSNSLAQQIVAGAPADIFLSASPGWAAAVEQAGMAEQTINLLTNKLVMVVPTGNTIGIRSPDDLLLTQVKRIAVAGKNVPAGIYAEQTLARLGLFEKLTQDHKLVRGSDVRVALAYVERGEVDAGIVYATDAQLSTHVECVWEFDQHLHEPIVYPAVFVRQKQASSHAADFFEFLRSTKAANIFQEYGFASEE